MGTGDIGARFSRGAQLLKKWQSKDKQSSAAEVLGLDEVSYSRFLRGVRRPPPATAIAIEQKTSGAVPFRSWFEPPRKRRAA